MSFNVHLPKHPLSIPSLLSCPSPHEKQSLSSRYFLVLIFIIWYSFAHRPASFTKLPQILSSWGSELCVYTARHRPWHRRSSTNAYWNELSWGSNVHKISYGNLILASLRPQWKVSVETVRKPHTWKQPLHTRPVQSKLKSQEAKIQNSITHSSGSGKQGWALMGIIISFPWHLFLWASSFRVWKYYHTIS